MLYQKYCFIIVKILRNLEFFYLDLQEYQQKNIGGITIHSGLRITPRMKLYGLNGRSKAALRNRLSEARFFIIAEFSMVSSDL